MKILLLGDLSGLHKNLREGLFKCNYKNTTLATSGDGYKSIMGDISLPIYKNYSSKDKLRVRYEFFNFLYNLRGYDIIQLAGPYTFPFPFFPYKLILNRLKKNNGKIFLCACGSDSFFWRNIEYVLKYGKEQLNETKKFDMNNKSPSRLSKRDFEFNSYIADNVDGIIPVNYEYHIAYKSHPNLRNFIPQPIDIKENNNQNAFDINNCKIFHGLSRYGMKGTRFIESAFKKLENSKFRNHDFVIKGQLPLEKYLKEIESSTIIVDQCFSRSYGMNALYAMSLGKIVLSGADKSFIKFMKLKKIPVINIIPESKQIFESISNLLENPNKITKLSIESRKYVEKNHDSTLIAKKFIKEWDSTMF